MNGKRAKKMRALVSTLGHDPVSRYSEVRFNRTFTYMKDGKLMEGTYPVRTLFLVKCQRAVYRRLKRKGKAEQNSIMELIGGVL